MGSRKIIMLVGSILIGAIAGLVLLNYVQGVEEDVENRVARVDVFVITQDVIAGTTASEVQQTSRIQQQQIESTFRPATAITDLAQIQGRVAVSNLAANQVLVAGMFEDPQTVETTYADLIADDHVAFSMEIDKDKAVNGFVEPGNFVDLIHLGAPPETPGEENAFETSAASSPYSQPARYLYRGVRIVSIGNEIAGQARPVAADGAPAAAPTADDAGTLSITLAVPTNAAQRILSVNPDSLVLSLLPADWEPVSQGNVILDEILIDADLPGEDPTQITPDGPAGFVDELADAAEAAADQDAEAAFSDDPVTGTDEDAGGDDGATE